MSGIYAIVLAAGAGSRFGGSKLTASWRGGVLLEAALRSACAAPVQGVVVVTGAHAAAVGRVVRDFACRSPIPLSIVECADHASGMSASLRCGLAALPAARAAFVFLGDMPLVPPELAGLLLAAVRAGALAAAPATATRIGHPVLISRALFASFSAQGGDGGGRRILHDLGEGLARIDVADPGVFLDIDTLAELDRAVTS